MNAPRHAMPAAEKLERMTTDALAALNWATYKVRRECATRALGGRVGRDPWARPEGGWHASGEDWGPEPF